MAKGDMVNSLAGEGFNPNFTGMKFNTGLQGQMPFQGSTTQTNDYLIGGMHNVGPSVDSLQNMMKQVMGGGMSPQSAMIGGNNRDVMDNITNTRRFGSAGISNSQGYPNG